MLSLKTKANARLYRKFLATIQSGGNLTLSEKRLMDSVAVELNAEVNPDDKVVAEGLQPLTYMLRVMNDPQAEKERRDRMAIAAAPFIHPRKGEGAGKKEDKADRAKVAGSGKFKTQAPPHLKVVN
jgi:hypothetical protein